MWKWFRGAFGQFVEGVTYDAFSDGNTFLAGVLAKLPEAVRAQVKDVFDKPEAKDAVTLVGDSVLARSDYSRNMDALKIRDVELNTRFTTLNTWYENNQAALKEYPALKAERDRLKAGAPDPDPDPDPDKGKKDQPDIRQVALDAINNAAPEYIAVSAWLAAKTDAHRAMFGEPLDAVALVRNPKLGKDIAGQPGRVYSLEDAYTEAFGERVKTKATEAETKRINDLVEVRLKEERAKLAGQPFPLRGEAAPSVLDVLSTKEGPAVHTLDTAVAEYERLQAAHTSG
jgi:hypothetical protein